MAYVFIQIPQDGEINLYLNGEIRYPDALETYTMNTKTVMYSAQSAVSAYRLEAWAPEDVLAVEVIVDVYSKQESGRGGTNGVL